MYLDLALRYSKNEKANHLRNKIGYDVSSYYRKYLQQVIFQRTGLPPFLFPFLKNQEPRSVMSSD